jgi:hypothetical protein
VKRVRSNTVTAFGGKHEDGVVEKGQEKITANKLLLHKDFGEVKFDGNIYPVNDIALVKLSTAMPFSDTIRPICLPSQNESLPTDKLCYAAGWGRTDRKFCCSILTIYKRKFVQPMTKLRSLKR